MLIIFSFFIDTNVTLPTHLSTGFSMANRLALEDSPYLQQHKENPFDWYPWCTEAFETAKAQNKPIFISIGYSSCHWCHVMEHEVFENDEIAQFVNQHFICIKVDREERPDIDKHYQELHQLLNRRAGGWPLSVFCTPHNKPFYAATYIPPYDRDRMMGFSTLASIIAQKVSENDEKLFQNADEISSFLRIKKEPVQATALNEKIIRQYTLQALHNFDADNGGFSNSPKFPHVSTLKTLMTIDRLESSQEIRQALFKSLDGMILGGMYDHIDGGFCRYSTDETWLVPHFEKMTYDNALLCALYAEAGSVYQNSRYLEIARECADFMCSTMMESNLFFSASDADSEGEEGKYFVYSYSEVRNALQQCGIDDPEALSRIGVSESGNFEGHSIIRFERIEPPSWFEPLKNRLKEIRKERIYPFIDRKVITAWNAMMIRALFILGNIYPSYRIQAEKSMEALLQSMYGNGELKHSALIGKPSKVDAFLEDYAYLCAALIEGYQSGADEMYLLHAQKMANKALELYYEEGRWYFSRGEFATLAEADDSTYPSALGVMVESLQALGTLIDEKYNRFAFKSLEFLSLKLMKTPIYFPTLAAAAIRHQKEVRIVKANAASFERIPRPFTYPFVLLQRDDSAQHYLLCGETSCFATTENPEYLENLIQSSLQ